MTVLRAIASTLWHAPPGWLLVGVAVLGLAWLLRGARGTAAAGRVALLVAGVVVLGLALRRGAQRAGEARRKAEFREGVGRAQQAELRQYLARLASWSACQHPRTTPEPRVCLALALDLMDNMYCSDDCMTRLATRPDILAQARVQRGEDVPDAATSD